MSAVDLFGALLGPGAGERALVRLAAPTAADTALVIGGGTGLAVLPEVAARAGHTVGVGTTPLARELATARCRESAGLTVREGSAADTGADDASVQVALWLDAAQPVRAAAAELWRVLAPGGRLLVGGPEQHLDQRALSAVMRGAGFADVQCWRYQSGLGGVAVQLRAIHP